MENASHLNHSTFESRHQSVQQPDMNNSKMLSTNMVNAQGAAPLMKLKFQKRSQYPQNKHTDVLSMPKPEYQGKDFFQRQEFRGLLLADYQEAIGEKAFVCVD